MDQGKSAVVSAIVSSLTNAADTWRYRSPGSTLVIRHQHSPLALWVGCGGVYVYEPHEMQFGFWQHRRLRRAFKRWQRIKGNADISEADTALCAQILGWLP